MMGSNPAMMAATVIILGRTQIDHAGLGRYTRERNAATFWMRSKPPISLYLFCGVDHRQDTRRCAMPLALLTADRRCVSGFYRKRPCFNYTDSSIQGSRHTVRTGCGRLALAFRTTRGIDEFRAPVADRRAFCMQRSGARWVAQGAMHRP